MPLTLDSLRANKVRTVVEVREGGKILLRNPTTALPTVAEAQEGGKVPCSYPHTALFFR